MLLYPFFFSVVYHCINECIDWRLFSLRTIPLCAGNKGDSNYFEEQGIIEIASAVNNAFGLHDNDIQDLAVSLCS